MAKKIRPAKRVKRRPLTPEEIMEKSEEAYRISKAYGKVKRWLKKKIRFDVDPKTGQVVFKHGIRKYRLPITHEGSRLHAVFPHPLRPSQVMTLRLHRSPEHVGVDIYGVDVRGREYLVGQAWNDIEKGVAKALKYDTDIKGSAYTKKGLGSLLFFYLMRENLRQGVTLMEGRFLKNIDARNFADLWGFKPRGKFSRKKKLPGGK